MKLFYLTIAGAIAAITYGISRKPRSAPISQVPGDPGTTVPITASTQLIPGTKIRVDGPRAGLNSDGTFLFQVTEQLPGGDVKAKSLDPRLPNNPLGIGPDPIPIPRGSISGVAA